MVDDYKQDPDFASIYQKLEQGQMISPYSIKDGFLMHGQCLCISKAFREKVMQENDEPPYAGHRGTQAAILTMRYIFIGHECHMTYKNISCNAWYVKR